MTHFHFRHCTLLFLYLLFVASTAFQLPVSSLQRSKSNRYDFSPYSPITQSLSTTQLSLAPAPPQIITQLGSLSVLATVILVHEAGHYLAAKTLFGMKVDEFSIGVGPKLLGFEWMGNDFSLRAIPLGGYVKFPENYNTTLALQRDDERMLWEAQNTETKFQRQVNNVLSLGTYEIRLEALKKQKEKQQKEEGKKLALWKRLFAKKSATSSSLNASTSTTPPSDFDIDYYTDPDLLQNRPWPQRAVVIAGGVIFNFLLAFSLYFAQISTGPGLAQPLVEVGARVNQMPLEGTAVYGKLQPNDVILNVNGRPLMKTTNKKLNMASSSQAIQDFIQTIRTTPEGESVTLKVVKASSQGSNNLVDIVVKPQINPGATSPSIGAMLGPNVQGIQRIRGANLVESSRLATQCVAEITTETWNGFLQILSQMLAPSAKSGGGGPQLSGPLGLMKTGNEVVRTAEWTAILTFAAAISINLAVVNSLPLPALDGGQMVFVLAEAVTGKKVNQRLQETVTSLAVVLLLVLSLSTTVGDVQSIFFQK